MLREAKDTDRSTLRQMGFHEAILERRTGREYTYVIEEGGKAVAAACGVVPFAGKTAILGGMALGRTWNRKRFHELLIALIRKAAELGFTYGQADVPADLDFIIEFLRREYDLEPKAAAWEPATNYEIVKLWRYTINLSEFLEAYP